MPRGPHGGGFGGNGPGGPHRGHGPGGFHGGMHHPPRRPEPPHHRGHRPPHGCGGCLGFMLCMVALPVLIVVGLIF